jgi:hypothetical protein
MGKPREKAMQDSVADIEAEMRDLLGSQQLADELAELDMDDAESALRSRVDQSAPR